jgi:hypothetical protein
MIKYIYRSYVCIIMQSLSQLTRVIMVMNNTFVQNGWIVGMISHIQPMVYKIILVYYILNE